MKTLFILLLLGSTIFCFAQKNSRGEPQRIPGVAGFSANYENHKPPSTRGESMPSAFSLKKFVPPVGDQGDKGTCVGWATTYAGMTILENIELKREGAKLNTNDCLSPQMTYDICRFSSDSSCENGTYVKAALNVLTNFGTTTLADYPYQCAQIDQNRIGVQRLYNDSSSVQSVMSLLKKARTRRLEGYIPIGGANIIENVKYYLSKNMPVVIAAEMYNSIQSNSVNGVWNGAMDSYPGGHAMCVIGYDDKKEGGAFEILNSWGDDWSASGFVWFRYADFAKVVDEAYALKGIKRELEKNVQIYNYDFTISAIGKKTSSTLDISSESNKLRDTDMKIGGLAQNFVINYPSDETEYSLSIKNNIPDGFYAYIFSICCGGKVSLLSPSKGSSNFYQGINSGLIIPSDQLTGIPLTQGYYEGDEVCVILSKKELDQQKIENSLMSSYSNLATYVNANFSDRITLNKPKAKTYFSGKMTLKNSNELNDIQPVFFSYNEIVKDIENETYDLFNEVNLESKKRISGIRNLKYKFQRNFYDDEYNLIIKVKRNWMRLGLVFKVKVLIDNVDNGIDYSISFNAVASEISNKLNGEIFNCLLQNKVSFTVAND
jgi:C1A family cysteine protease